LWRIQSEFPSEIVFAIELTEGGYFGNSLLHGSCYPRQRAQKGVPILGLYKKKGTPRQEEPRRESQFWGFTKNKRDPKARRAKKGVPILGLYKKKGDPKARKAKKGSPNFP
jgi:hypothetical protein